MVEKELMTDLQKLANQVRIPDQIPTHMQKPQEQTRSTQGVEDTIAMQQALVPRAYIPAQPPEADRVKELWYTTHLEGSVDIEERNKEGKLIGITRTPGDIPESMKREYTYSVNKLYSLGTVDEKEMRIDSLEHELLMLFKNSQMGAEKRDLTTAYEQQGIRMIHGSQVNMSKDGFNRQMSSTVTQMQGQFYKVGRSMKDMARRGMDALRGKNE